MRKVYVVALVILVPFLIVGLWLASQALWFGGTVVNSAHGVVSRTLDPDNVIFQYEHFHDLCHDILAFNSQLATAQEVYKNDQAHPPVNDPFGAYQQRLANEQANIQGIENERDNTAQQYNSDSHKINRTIFKSHNLPASIDPPSYTNNCEYTP